MLSVILYGRNDQHGYHYHKRLAISLNTIAASLTDPNDEILFVDYNSPNDFPTVIEAIQDTLTSHAKSLIRVFRIRPHHHQLFSAHTRLPVLEPIARNVALYRSNPDNRWILSTNPDMLFVPVSPDQSLTTLLTHLPNGFYSLPRYELPEQYWEQALDRLNPQHNMDVLRSDCHSLHLDTTVRMKGFLSVDNPGDFQLILRKDLIEMGGFDEAMLQGWHVDANLSKRASLFIQHHDSLEKQLLGFHCNHTETVSLLHHPHSIQNNWNEFVNNDAIAPCLSSQKGGLLDQDIEEIKLTTHHSHIPILRSLLETALIPPKELMLGPDSYNQLTYSPSRIFTFLTDHLCHLPLHTTIAYIGYNTTMIDLINQYLQARNFYHPLLTVDIKTCIHQAQLFIFDFGFDEHSTTALAIAASPQEYSKQRAQLKTIMNDFFLVTHHPTVKRGTKVIGINVINTDINTIFNQHLSVRANSLITGISYGYASHNKQKQPLSWQSRKKRLITQCHYWIVRYCFSYSDKIYSYLSRFKVIKFLKKT